MATPRVKEALIALVAAAVVALAVGGLAALLGGGDESPSALDTAPPPTSELARPVPTAPPASAVPPESPGVTAEPPESPGVTVEPPEVEPLPEMGIATVAFEWQEADLPLDAGEVWLESLFEFGGRYWAVAVESGERVTVLTSPDGLAWVPVALPDELGRGHVGFWPTRAGLVAVSDRWDEDAELTRQRLFVSTDGTTWTASDPSQLAAEGEYMWLTGAAGGDGVIVVAGARELVPAGEGPNVITIEHAGLTVEIDEATGSYLITDDGEVVAHGSMDLVWGQGEQAAAIYEPGAREPVFRAGWDDLDAAAQVAYEDTPFGERLIVEVVGEHTTLALDEYAGTLAVTDASGAVLFTGSEDELFRGPPPTFIDSSGEVILVVPWEQWEAALEEAYGTEAYGEATPVLIRSVDGGASWTVVTLPAAGVAGTLNLGEVAWRAGEFVALGAVDVGARHDPQPEPVVFRSRDGATWERVAVDLPAGWVHGLVATDDGFLAIQAHGDGTRVVASPDGATWDPVLSQADMELPLGSVWFDRVARGGVGTVVSGSWDAWEMAEPQAVTIAKQGRTLTMEGPVHTITDDGTGAVLARFDESSYWEVEQAPAPADTGFKWGYGGIAVFDPEGRLIFSASHREMSEAWEDAWVEPAAEYRHEPFLVVDDGAAWERVALPDELGPDTWCSGLVAGDDHVVMAAHTDVIRGEDWHETRIAILVGTPG